MPTVQNIIRGPRDDEIGGIYVVRRTPVCTFYSLQPTPITLALLHVHVLVLVLPGMYEA